VGCSPVGGLGILPWKQAHGMVRSSGRQAHRRDKRLDSHDVHDPCEVVSEHVQGHLGGHLRQALHQECVAPIRIYLPTEDAYRCPAGEKLTPRFSCVENGMVLHRYWTSACYGCPIRPQCTTGPGTMVAGAQFMNQLVPFPSGQAPVLIAAASERARVRFIEFFTANIRNPHTRRA
jgi:hypothetical protein